MGTGHVNIWLRNAICDVIPDCWRTDLVIQGCNGNYLVNTWPKIIDQLKKRYSTPATVADVDSWPLITDQGGKTLTLNYGTSSEESVIFASPATSQSEIFDQMANQLTKYEVKMVDNRIRIYTLERGPGASITISGDANVAWGAPQAGGGWKVLSHFYQNAQRIMLMPPNGEFIDDIHVDIPPGCYKIWTRVCHGANEETSVNCVYVGCGGESCVCLMLPAVKTCSGQVLFPLMKQLVKEQALNGDDDRLAVMRGIMYAAHLGKNAVIVALDQQIAEAQEKGDTELEADIQALKTLAQQLPEC